MFFAAAFLLAALFPAASRAMLVSLSLTYANEGALRQNNLQVGSIVQVIAYNTTEASQPDDTQPPDPGRHFDHYGNITTNDPAYAPAIDAGIYLPNTTPDNHYIVYTGHITQLDNGQYGIVTDFTMDNSFNALYVRVFETNDFHEGQVVLTHWGLDGLTTGINPTLGHYSYNVSDVNAEKLNYFEVIPEPATLTLFAVGTLALAAFRRNRHPKGKGVRS